MGSVAGRSVVITGAASGLGAVLSAHFCGLGARVLAADRDAAGLDELRDRINGDLVPFTVDVTDAAGVERMVDRAAEVFGSVDVLVNNAGVLSPNARTHNVDAADLTHVLAVNVVGTFNGMKAALRHMRPAGRGSIINTGSVAGLTGWPYASAYCASKGAVIQLTKTAAVEYAKEGIRVNCVCPGTFRSRIHDDLPSEAVQALADRHPVGRLGTAEEIVSAYSYLAGDDASFTTGTILVIDGGYTAV